MPFTQSEFWLCRLENTTFRWSHENIICNQISKFIPQHKTPFHFSGRSFTEKWLHSLGTFFGSFKNARNHVLTNSYRPLHFAYEKIFLSNNHKHPVKVSWSFGLFGFQLFKTLSLQNQPQPTFSIYETLKIINYN